MKKILSLAFVVLTATLLVSCGGGGGGGDLAPETITSKASGDLRMAGALVGDGSALKLSLNSIIDPATGEPIEDLKASNFKINETEGVSESLIADEKALAEAIKAAVTPSAFEYASSSEVLADIVFIFDITGSMTEEINGVKDSIRAFASAISKSGINAKFALVSYGDAFNLKKAEESIYTIGTGEPDLPSFDPYEYPVLDLTTLADLEKMLDELTITYGGDLPENGLGTVNFANNASNITYRDGAARIFIVITDATSHDNTTFKALFKTVEGYETWLPPATATIAENLQGAVTVHVVGPAVGTGAGYFNLRQLADGKTADDSAVDEDLTTGGKFILLPASGDVDLVSLGISGTISYASSLVFTPEITSGRVTYTFTITYGGKTGTLEIAVEY